jgi:hypothetical protein
MAGHEPLKLGVQVRVLAPQPFDSVTLSLVVFAHSTSEGHERCA